MKRFISAALLLFSINAFCQDFQPLKSFSGIDITYKSTKVKEDDKKDSWIIEVDFINKSGEDYYYKESKEGNVDYFADIIIENAKAVSFNSDKFTMLRGDVTQLKTDKDERIFKIKKNKTYNVLIKFKAEKGIEPKVSARSVNSIELITDLYDFL